MVEHLAVDGGAPVRMAPFPAWLVWGEQERDALLAVLDSGHWGELTGDRVQAFEDRFAAYQHACFGLAVPNGTQALELALQALGVGPGDEVITTPYTFIATVSAIFAAGARPIFVDIDPDTNLIDPALIEAAITSATRAIVPVHIGGQPCDLDAVLDVASRHGLPVVEDAAQAVGAEWRGRRVGALGDLGTFSFQESKNLSGGEGGALVTDRQDLHHLAWSVHNSGRGPTSGAFDFERMGGNYRMTELTGALLLAQMDRLDGQMAVRSRNAALLADGLVEITGLEPTLVDARVTRHAWHLYQIRYDAAGFGGRSREQFLVALHAEGIPASAGYVPLTDIEAVRTALRHRFGVDAMRTVSPVPNADVTGRTTLWFHQNALLGADGDTADIVAACRKIAAAWRSK